MDITDDQVSVAAQIRAELGLLAHCEDSTGAPYPGPGSNVYYCRRYAGHEAHGLAHRAEDGTEW